MKFSFLSAALAFSTFSFLACSHKTTPTNGNKNVNAQVVYGSNNTTANNNTVTPLITDGTPVPVYNEKVLIILDKGGRLTYTNKNVPSYVLAANKKLPDNKPVSPEQRNNMLARHKGVPPMALYVPDTLSNKSAKGQYYKYMNKFWYWKKNDGFYYLDEIYYQ
ncbi:hypothetical protein SAMN05421788_101424 [Filimonas lacunae]|uniref:Uncharacterized protein n=1 Tax=Filimonas lacunae TaxID=477680 RepID=A0A173MMU7_9BACT|nr:hypothetical protein [Filimonas lacunae]BAV08975.1 hypothetical protein FLA_5022 [Filimonas lacunae]SIS65078.1 hypothetical protein SAMN05421788_101424 [Filimonas lacunae]